MMSPDDISRFAADAEALFHQYANDAVVIDSQTLHSVCATAFADCKSSR